MLKKDLDQFIPPWVGERRIVSDEGSAASIRNFKARDEKTEANRTATTYKTPLLFTPLQLRDKQTLKNRVVLSPLCQYSSTDGFFNDWHLVHLGTFARGGVALTFTEATAVSPEGRITPYDAGLWKDEQIAGVARIADFVHYHGGLLGMQLAHAGRKASCFPPLISFPTPRTAISSPPPSSSPSSSPSPSPYAPWPSSVVGPSAIAFNSHHHPPSALSLDQISQVKSDFAAAAIRAHKAGIDVIEIHAAHGYLLSTFHSPLSNQRTDNYGGSFENRTRLTREVLQAVRDVWPKDKALGVRVSCTDWAEGGWTSEDSVRLGKDLAQAGLIDFWDASSGGVVDQQRVKAGMGYQGKLARAVKEAVQDKGVRVMMVGMIVNAAQAEHVLVNDEADLIAVGRELMRDPFWTLRAAKDLGVDVHWPKQYEWAVNPQKL
eukprot:TRINITY_DN2821_c1_g1_i1.p1 TRINITY_DN2821_c1_g1~~TRINITY_DN2821_c1_g1_i1.p1  ORF type:complete len:433 (+),score=124.91 TRINITY_DN2821_c1_g1_i1:135-1433(+)